MSHPSAGWYEGLYASIIQPPVAIVKGEPVAPKVSDWPTLYTGIPIRFPRNQFGWERGIQTQTTSVNAVYIRMRRNSLTEQITPQMKIKHGRDIYGITAKPRLDSQTDELEFLCQVVDK